MLDLQTFKTVIENVQLVSLELFLVFDNQLLLEKRTNEPLKSEWFTPATHTPSKSWRYMVTIPCFKISNIMRSKCLSRILT